MLFGLDRAQQDSGCGHHIARFVIKPNKEDIHRLVFNCIAETEAASHCPRPLTPAAAKDVENPQKLDKKDKKQRKK